MYGITGYSNGYHQNQHQHSSEEKRGGGRRRRGGRRSRHPPGFRVSDHHHHHYNNDDDDDKQEQKAPPPCTDFDMAYFHSYAHVGIHEEMIKVFSSFFCYFACYHLFFTGFTLFFSIFGNLGKFSFTFSSLGFFFFGGFKCIWRNFYGLSQCEVGVAKVVTLSECFNTGIQVCFLYLVIEYFLTWALSNCEFFKLLFVA